MPIREPRRLRDDFSFVDGLAWRQVLNWDYHRMRPKYRAHYSISVDEYASPSPLSLSLLSYLASPMKTQHDDIAWSNEWLIVLPVYSVKQVGQC